MTKFNKGPWTLTEKVSGMLTVEDPKGHPVILGTGLKNEKENLKLAASAPELFETVYRIACHLARHGEGPVNGADFLDFVSSEIERVTPTINKIVGGAK